MASQLVIYDLGMLLLQLGVCHVAVAHQMVALDAGALRGGPVEQLLPGVHRLADVHSAVVHQRGLDDLIAGSLQESGYAVAQQVIAYVAEVEGLVGIGR